MFLFGLAATLLMSFGSEAVSSLFPSSRGGDQDGAGGPDNDDMLPDAGYDGQYLSCGSGQDDTDFHEVYEGAGVVHIDGFDLSRDRLLLVLDGVEPGVDKDIVVRTNPAGDAILMVNGGILARLYGAGGLTAALVDVEYRSASGMFHVKRLAEYPCRLK